MANIQQRGDNSYFFTVSLGRGADGKYKRRTKTITVTDKMTPKQLKEYLDHEYLKFKHEALSGAYIVPNKISVSVLSEEWKEKYAFNELSKTTITNHLSILDTHVLPVIGHRSIQDVNPSLLEDLLHNLKRKDGSKKPLAVTSRQSVYNTLKSIFKYAKTKRLIKEDPMEGVSKPKIKYEEAKQMNVYDFEEVSLLLKLLEEERSHWRMFMTLLIVAGLRRGEGLGLEWKHIDLENGIIDISQTIVNTQDGPLIKGPKSKSSIRLVTLAPSVVEDLRSFKVEWDKNKLLMGDKWTEQERSWVFCNENGKHFFPTTPSTWWKRFTERTGFRYIRLHDLRHTSASLLIAQNVHAKVISERFGHSSIRITMDTYGHVLRTADKMAGDTFEILFTDKKIQNKTMKR
ncbi:site-specific integrase [Sporosarcina sp. USHLN248]|uniref:tyrosine-type recombinase/integrase n=1 Tax=Sporosarcina sp. USHLN248 TaxID=3081300 RepID=UPI00301B32CD